MYHPKQTEAQLFSAEPLLIYEAPAELLSQQPSPHYMFPCEQKPSGRKITKENMSSGIRTSHLGIRYDQQPFKDVFSVAEPLLNKQSQFIDHIIADCPYAQPYSKDVTNASDRHVDNT